ncbi:hypothetical protein, partial [Nocardioides sp.]|uniref:hypothetical protein n=1 Tax=Nocardioides sp. TaxID=35761 RepID=UPI0027323F42
HEPGVSTPGRPSTRRLVAAVVTLAVLSGIVAVLCVAASRSETSPSSADAFAVVGALNLAFVLAYVLILAATVRRSRMSRPLVLAATAIALGVAVVWVMTVLVVPDSLLLWVALPMAFTVSLALHGAWYETRARLNTQGGATQHPAGRDSTSTRARLNGG